MGRLRKFIINKLGGIPREEAIINNYKVEHVAYPTIKLARVFECPWDHEMINCAERELAREIGVSLFETNLLQIEHERNYERNSIKLCATIEVVDRR